MSNDVFMLNLRPEGRQTKSTISKNGTSIESNIHKVKFAYCRRDRISGGNSADIFA